ncbi:hypothetical protein ScPMuIL_015329 [Solemya velum]
MVLTLRKVLISDEVDAKCIEVLKSNGIDVEKNTKLTKEQLVAEIPKYDGLIVRSATKVTADVINAASNLRIIGRAGTGVDNIDCEAATKKGIIVMNTPGGNTLSAAEHTCAMVVSLSREVPLACQSMKEGRWDRKKFMGSELNGKTLGIIGLGRIGKEVALRMQSFGMKTIGFDPIIPAEVAAEFNVEWMPLEKLWPQIDYVTVHTPLIPQTTNLINDKVFGVCKKGVKIINCARGGIVDEAALLRALESGQCGGAGFDVFVQEPPTDLTLVKHPKMIATPHLGANTSEAQKRVAVEIAEQFVDAVNGKSLFGALNAAAMATALSPDTQPWVNLAQKLGKLAASVNSDIGKEITIIAKGPELAKAGSYLSAAFLSGLLQNSSTGSGDQVVLNLVNAPALAKQMGITVKTETKEVAHGAFKNAVCFRLGNGFCVSGTTSGSEALLLKIKGAQFSSPVCLSGSLLVFRGTGNSQLLPKVAGALGSARISLEAVSTSSEENAAKWGVANLTNPAGGKGVQAIKDCVDFVTMVTV